MKPVFTPSFLVKVRAAHPGARLHVTASLHPLSRVYRAIMVVCAVGFTAACASQIVTGECTLRQLSVSALLPVLMVLLIVLLITLVSLASYRLALSQARAQLAKLAGVPAASAARPSGVRHKL